MSYLIPPRRTDKADVDAFVAGVKRVKDKHEAENAEIAALTTKLEAAEKERDEYKTGWEKASEAYRLLRDTINTTMENFK